MVAVGTSGSGTVRRRVTGIAIITTDLAGRVVEEWESTPGAAFAGVVPELNRRLAGAAIVAHNAEFDLAVLRAEYRRAGWQLPQVPALSVLEASVHLLPALERRRPADIGEALGVPGAGSGVGGAVGPGSPVGSGNSVGSVLGEARVLAGVLAVLLGPDATKASLVALPARAQTVTWPSAPTLTPRDDSPSGLHGGTPVPSGTALLERFSLIDALDEGAPAAALGYLEKLAEVFQDGTVTPQETTALAQVAAAEELTADDVARAAEAFVRALTHAALGEGALPAAEREGLLAVAGLLGVGERVVLKLVDAAESAARERARVGRTSLPGFWSLGEPLRVGDKVVFSGCDPDLRETLESRSRRLGVRVVGTVSPKTALLVSDGSVEGVRVARALEIGTRIVKPEEYALLLDHLQPVHGGEWAAPADGVVTVPETVPVVKPVVAEPVLAETVLAETVLTEPEAVKAVTPEAVMPEPVEVEVVTPDAVGPVSAEVVADETATPLPVPEPAVAETDSADSVDGAEASPAGPEAVSAVPEPEPEPEPDAVSELKVVPEPEAVAEAEVMPEPKVVPQLKGLPEPEAVPEPEVVAEAEAVPEPNVVPQLKGLPEPEAVPESEALFDEDSLARQDVAPEPAKPAPKKPRARRTTVKTETAPAPGAENADEVPQTKTTARRSKASTPGSEDGETQAAPRTRSRAASKTTASKTTAAQPKTASRATAGIPGDTQAPKSPVAKSPSAKGEVSKSAAPELVPQETPAKATPPKAAEVRAWARANGHEVSVRGALPKELVAAYLAATSGE
ncbi:Lsr2 family protein [Kineosporia sp. J2-2]|uniref:Lsr2 family protein n=1 Tax=Kineosporia corallincola TaxID=2835133 RepID=A0ABS5TAU8_9ACTN|nr:histone-like nucleoid-structuring protein Lsr2 [Kineosporia corallincola]MBT0768182.1 Lsr2 family protein [Kineosporia corallincola]